MPRTGYRFAVPVEVVESSLNETFTTDAASLGAIVSGADSNHSAPTVRESYFLEREGAGIRRAAVFFQSSLQASSDYVPSLIGLARAHQYLGTYWASAAEPRVSAGA